MTLSAWFREYVYIPLGGNRKGLAVQLVNILVVWVLTGIWHRADWTFLLWGLWFALFLILEKLFLKKVLNRLPKVLGWLYTLTVVLVSWVLFSLDSLPVIEGYLGAMFGLGGGALWDMHGMFLGREYLILLAVAIVACLPLGKLIAEGMARSRNGLTMAIYRLGEKVIFPVLLLLSIAYLVQNDYTPFMYFRF
jgi:alginate O-acetyltransferase complex protein AlgI